MTVHIHPSVDQGVKKGSGSFAGGTLVCKCKDRPVKVGDYCKFGTGAGTVESREGETGCGAKAAELPCGPTSRLPLMIKPPPMNVLIET